MITGCLLKIPKSTFLGRFIRLEGKRLCLRTIIRNNVSADEIAYFCSIQGYPTVILSDGTSLSAVEGEIPYYKNAFLPSEYVGVVLEYITRYKYPHFMPSARVKTGLIPRNHFPLILHPQHKNTLYELPMKDRDEFSSALELKSGDRVLEIGPYIGFGTVRMSKIVGAKGRVICIEADEEFFDVLNINIEQNNLNNVSTLNCAVADVDEDELTIYKGGNTSNSIVEGVIKNCQVSSVKGRTIQTILKEYNVTPNFLVLTINGAELRVLNACRELIRNTSPLRIITPGWYDDGQGKVGPRIVSLLSSLGFRVSYTPGMHIFAFK